MAKNNISQEEQKQLHFVEGGRAPYITILQTERTVIGYGITEDELERVGNLNTQAATFFSVCAGLATFAVGLVVDWLMGGQTSNYGEIFAKVVAPICAGLASVFLFLAIRAVKERGSIVGRIKAQSKLIKKEV